MRRRGKGALRSSLLAISVWRGSQYSSWKELLVDRESIFTGFLCLGLMFLIF